MDRRLGELARRNLGLLTRDQAHAAGLTSSQINHRLSSGRWERIGRGVYRIRGTTVTSRQQLLAACWSGPAGAMAFGLSALSLLDLAAPPDPPHLVAPPTASGRHPVAVVHRLDIPTCDRTVVGVVPATTPARSIVDAAGQLADERFAGLLAAAFTRRVTRPAAVGSALRRATGGRRPAGADRLVRALDPWLAGLVPDSPGEARLLRRLREWGVADPVTQFTVLDPAGRFVARLDLAWPHRRVGLEYDGEEFHGPDRLAADEERHARLIALGWRVLRADKHDLRPSADRLRGELAVALSRPRAAS